MYACINMIDNVQFFKALGEETRLKIVGYLLNNNSCACDFIKLTKKDQTTLSRHFKVLIDAGIVKSEKNGRNVLYRINDNVKNKLEVLGLKSTKHRCCK